MPFAIRISCFARFFVRTKSWPLHSHVASLLDSARLELRELKAHSTLFGAYTSCPLLISDLEASAVEIMILSTNMIILLATLFYPIRA
jgi:hypothetical protein